LEVFFVHPGGPFFAKKDLGAWTIPEGEYLKDEDPLQAAKREFQEETGFPVAESFVDLGSVK
jgi:predicted NUDIX family NTP pyrophosphohydrolase